MAKTYDVAAYVWPSYSGDDPRARIFWPEGLGEWETVRKAAGKRPGHDWPRKPVWGHVNEADRYVMEMQIAAAADHGVNVFIYDWYWYDRRPFLENCLNDGFLKARNNDRMRFYLMWANHDATTLWDIRNSHDQQTPIWEGAVDRAEFERLGARLLERYFRHPCYYRIDGKPVLAVYSLDVFLRGLGGIDPAARAMDWLRERAVRAGLPGLHWQLILYGNGTFADGVSGKPASVADAVRRMGWESATQYQMCVHGSADPNLPYPDIAESEAARWPEYAARCGVPYFPHVAVGWDNNPRFRDYIPSVVSEATPANVERAFRLARRYVDGHPGQPPLITVNSWNEWTETSYLQPDDKYGYSYLEAVRRVFVDGL